MVSFPSPTSKYHSIIYPAIDPQRPELSAKGKNVLITGGGTGIGAETVRYFAQAGAARIAILGRREQPLLDTKAAIEHQFPSVAVSVAPTDVTNKSEVDAAFSDFAGDGKIHVVVSGAAQTGPLEPVSKVDPKKFLEGVNANIEGALNVAQAFIRYAAPDAVAVNVSSSAAHVNFAPGFTSYSVAKLAVVRLWDSLAFGNSDMRVFHVQPGVVDTDLSKSAGGVAAVGSADDASLPAGFIVWLASPEARFLKGKFLWANWDVDELKARAKEIGSTSYLDIGLVGWPFGQDGWKFELANDDSRWSS